MHYQYYNSNALLVINPDGRIKILYTPFRVKPIAGEMKAAWVYVDEVLSNEKDELFYVVNAKAYLYRQFKIEVLF